MSMDEVPPPAPPAEPPPAYGCAGCGAVFTPESPGYETFPERTWHKVSRPGPRRVGADSFAKCGPVGKLPTRFRYRVVYWYQSDDMAGMRSRYFVLPCMLDTPEAFAAAEAEIAERVKVKDANTGASLVSRGGMQITIVSFQLLGSE